MFRLNCLFEWKLEYELSVYYNSECKSDDVLKSLKPNKPLRSS